MIIYSILIDTHFLLSMRSTPAQPSQQDHVLALCHMLSNRIGRVFGAELEAYGITAAEWRVILTLGLHEQASGRDITNRWAMDKMAISRAISNLQKQGLVNRKQNKQDKRSFDLKLTKAGKKLYAEILPEANHLYHEILSCLDKQEVRALRNTLIKMINHIDDVENRTQ